MSIKSKYFLITLALVGAGFADQAEAQLLPRFGLRTGLGMSKFTGDITGAKFGMGFGVGGTMVIDLLPLSIVTDLYFARRNYGNSTVSTKTWELLLPVQARFYVAPMFFVQAGAGLGFGIGSYTTSNNGLGSQSFQYGQSTLSRMDFGLLFGLGADVPLGVGSLQVEGRFNWGLKDRNELPVQNIKTMHMDLLVGFLF